MAELSGLEVFALTKEIGLKLRGAYVNNIYSLGRAQVIRFRRPEGEDVWIVASPQKGVWVSDSVSERAETTEFTSTLRRELERAKFVSAAQVDLDRVFELVLGEAERQRKLIVELMPPGNIVVVDREGVVKVLEADVRSPARRLGRGMVYAPPAQRRLSLLNLGVDDVVMLAESERTVGKAIGKNLAMPRKYVAEACSRLSLDEGSPSSSLRGKESMVVEVLRQLVEEVRRSPRPCVCSTPSGDEVFAILPKAYEVKKEDPSLSRLCDELFLPELSQAAVEGATTEDDERKELEGTISRLKSEEEALVSDAAKSRSAAAEVSASNSVAEALKLLEGVGIHTRRTHASTAAVASALYDRAKELEERAKAVHLAAGKLTKRAARVRPKAKPPPKRLSRKKQEWFERFRWFITSEGRLAVGGRDAHSNSILVRRHVEEGDTIYHADLFGSPFFLLKGGSRQTDLETREVSQATVAFSSAWKTGLSSADAYWVYPGQLGAAAPSGEYLPRGSFAVKGRKNFVGRNLVEVAVGVDTKGRVVAGPESALGKALDHYVVVRPHREKASETAKRVLGDLRALTAEAPEVTIDDVLRALPPGGGKVIRKA
jgi:predicted ribosome quality control (RQC) complex YloA/Tae2 family protein